MSDFLDEHETVAKLDNNLDSPNRHNVAGPLNRPTDGQLKTAGRVTDPDDRPQVMILRLGQQYHDSREDITVEPIEFYGDKIMIKDGRSCSVTYARSYWNAV